MPGRRAPPSRSKAGGAAVSCAARGTRRYRCARRSASTGARRQAASPPAPRPRRSRRAAGCVPRSARTASTRSSLLPTDPLARRRPGNVDPSTRSRGSERPRHEAYAQARTERRHQADRSTVIAHSNDATGAGLPPAPRPSPSRLSGCILILEEHARQPKLAHDGPCFWGRTTSSAGGPVGHVPQNAPSYA